MEHHRTPTREPAQRFAAGPSNARQLTHDAHLYRAYLRSADRLHAQGARVQRVVLEDDLKREYQAFLQEGDRRDRNFAVARFLRDHLSDVRGGFRK